MQPIYLYNFRLRSSIKVNPVNGGKNAIACQEHIDQYSISEPAMREELSMELYHDGTDCEYCDDKKIHVSPNLKTQNVWRQ